MFDQVMNMSDHMVEQINYYLLRHLVLKKSVGKIC